MTFFTVVSSIILIALFILAFAGGIVLAIIGIKVLKDANGWDDVLICIALLFLAFLAFLFSTLFLAPFIF